MNAELTIKEAASESNDYKLKTEYKSVNDEVEELNISFKGNLGEEANNKDHVSDDVCTPPDATSNHEKPPPTKEKEANADVDVSGYYSITDFDKFKQWLADNYAMSPNTTPMEPTKVLVLDMDDTLVCQARGVDTYTVWVEPYSYSIRHRPGLNLFLNEMSKVFRSIVIYTSSSKPYAGQIIRKINERYAEEYPTTTNIISAALYGNDCINDCGEKRKDLLRVPGVSSLEDVVFVDDDPYYAILSQDDNILHIPKCGGFSDEWLLLYTPLLVHLSQVNSVMEEIKTFKRRWMVMGMLKTVISTLGVV